MQDYDRLITRFRQFGGMRLVWEYAKLGVLWIGVKEIARCILHGRSFKRVYPVVTRRVDEMLVKKYSHIPRSTEGRSQGENPCSPRVGVRLEQKGSKVWTCWLQGMENAPELVRACVESMRRTLPDEVVVIDERNYTDYVTLPDYVVEKYNKGRIPDALFSDMLRLELLINHGGTWIDSTVLSTVHNPKEGKPQRPSWKEITGSELFLYRYYRNGRVEGTSNWFIHAKAGNALLADVRDMLYAYWRDYDCTVEYYIFHLFFSVAARWHPDMIHRMPKGNSYHALMLRDNIDKAFDAEWWRKLTDNVPFHKLNYRKVPVIRQGTYYEFIVHSSQFTVHSS